MTTWTEAQIDRHLHLWEHRHGPDSPEAGIVRQLRAERDAAREVLKPIHRACKYSDELNQRDPTANCTPKDMLATFEIRNAAAALPTTQDTPHD